MTGHQKPISATDFPALHNFLRGYFHQDMKDAYGSAAGAASAFWHDAAPADRTALSRDWQRFIRQTNGMPLDEINRILTGPLGSSYSLQKPEIDEISRILGADSK